MRVERTLVQTLAVLYSHLRLTRPLLRAFSCTYNKMYILRPFYIENGMLRMRKNIRKQPNPAFLNENEYFHY